MEDTAMLTGCEFDGSHSDLDLWRIIKWCKRICLLFIYTRTRKSHVSCIVTVSEAAMRDVSQLHSLGQQVRLGEAPFLDPENHVPCLAKPFLAHNLSKAQKKKKKGRKLTKIIHPNIRAKKKK
jgi:hypothetical protein